ncbi:hypothetical protein LINGRAHAP2_LOCUS6761 [Linum grandiflorum]
MGRGKKDGNPSGSSAKKAGKGVPPTRSSQRLQTLEQKQSPAPKKRKQISPTASDSDFEASPAPAPPKRAKKEGGKKKQRRGEGGKTTNPKTQFRCKTRGLMELNDVVAKHKYKNQIRRYLMDANFHALLDVKVTCINKEVSQFLLDSYDCQKQDFRFPNGEILDVKPSDVNRVYGVMSRGSSVNSEEEVGYDDRRAFEGTTGIVGNVSGNIMLSTLEQIAKNIKNPIAFAKAYILYSLGSMLAATNSWKVTLNYATYLQGELEAVSSYNWSKHIVDSLIAAMDDLPKKKTYPGGDMNFLVVCSFSYTQNCSQF